MVDLHIHTSASSDAFTPPAEVVDIARANGLKAIAITDHRNIDGVAQAMQAGRKSGLEVVAGIELGTSCNYTHIHVTGLFIDPTSPTLLAFLTDLRAEHDKHHAINNQLMIGALAGMGFPLTIEQVAHLVEENIAWRSHFISFLENNGMIDPDDEKTKQMVEDKLMSINYYRYMNRKLQAGEVISQIHRAGGLAMLAHPMIYNMEWDDLDAMLAELKANGLDGIEVYYRDHNEEQRNKLLALAEKHNLLRSGGSDFHGYEKNDGSDIGKGLYGPLVPDEAFEEIKNTWWNRHG